MQAAHLTPPMSVAYGGGMMPHQHPAKKQKGSGGMTITKFSPPPGYTPSAQQPGYQHWPQMPFYTASPTYPNQATPQAYSYPYNAYNMPAQAAYAQQYASPVAYHGHSASYAMAQPAYAQAHGTVPYNVQYSSASPMTAPWQPPAAPATLSSVGDGNKHQQTSNTIMQPDQSRSYFEFFAGGGSIGEIELSEDAEEYCEFTRPCCYITKESEVDKDLSLGLIICKTASPSNLALPATWDEANPDPSAAIVPVPFETGRCPSTYHSEPLHESVLQPVKATKLWNEVRHDPIFKRFLPITKDLVSLTDLKAYVARDDLHWGGDKTSEAPRKHGIVWTNKKRIFSQTEHAPPRNEQNKRARDGRSSSSDHRSHDRGPASRHDSSNRGTHEIKNDRFKRNGAPRDSKAHQRERQKNESKLFANGRLKSLSSDGAHLRSSNHSPTKAPTIVTNNDALALSSHGRQGIMADRQAGAEPVAPVAAVTSNVMPNGLLPAASSTSVIAPSSTGSAPRDHPDQAQQPAALLAMEQVTSAAQQSKPLEQKMEPLPEIPGEGAWARRAREYQAASKRDFDQMEGEYGMVDAQVPLPSKKMR